ncbi:MAG: zinc-ribbon domain-containing protein [Nitrososphaerales archaeon]
MPRCPKCGKEVSEDVNYCPNCGSELRIDIEAIKLKVEDLRHDEKMAFWLFVFGIGIGFVFFILALWLILGFTATRYEWIGDTLYKITYHPYADIGMAIGNVGVIIAILIVVLGGALWFYYSYQRNKLMKRLPK